MRADDGDDDFGVGIGDIRALLGFAFERAEPQGLLGDDDGDDDPIVVVVIAVALGKKAERLGDETGDADGDDDEDAVGTFFLVSPKLCMVGTADFREGDDVGDSDDDDDTFFLVDDNGEEDTALVLLVGELSDATLGDADDCFCFCCCCCNLSKAINTSRTWLSLP